MGERFCTSCGHRTAEAGDFCGNCGGKLSPQAPPKGTEMPSESSDKTVQQPVQKSKVTMGCLVLVLGLFGIMTVCVMALPDPSPSTAESAQEDAQTLPRHTIIRSWKPSGDGYGADVLIEGGLEQVEESDLVALVQSLSNGRDPVIIRVWTSRIAHGDDTGASDEFKAGYILYYTKNTSRGSDEIRWFQEVGKFAHKKGRRPSFSTGLEAQENRPELHQRYPK